MESVPSKYHKNKKNTQKSYGARYSSRYSQ